MNKTSGGKIITFYSYKGGTGRSMALANVAWVLASNRKRVLILDWDLEAPGLHRYFRPFLIDKQLTSSEGLIDFVIDFADEAIAPSDSASPPPPDWYFPHADITRYALSVNVGDFFPKPGAIDLIPAGRQGATYATRVNSFNWQNFYDRLGGGAFIEKAKSFMREKYDYILVDSRTGVSDTAGICTVQMPDALVVCFTYNNQSIEGAAAVARSAREGRRQLHGAAGSSSFDIFPVPTRVEQAEQQKLAARQRYTRRHFDELLDPGLDRDAYWQAVEVPYIPFYGYEETLAFLVDNPNDPKSLLGAVVRITQRLTAKESGRDEKVDYNLPLSPELKQQLTLEFAATPGSEGEAAPPAPAATESPSEEKVRQAEAAFLRLEPAQQAEARRVLTRLVRVARRGEGEHARQRVRAGELSRDHQLVSFLGGAGLLTVVLESESSEPAFELADEALVRQWSRLRGWIDEDLDFLLWRQRLRDQIADWRSSNFKSGFLLRGEHLREARKLLGEHGADLNADEREFINRSSQSEPTEYAPQSRQAAVGVSAKRAFIIRPFGRKKDANGNEIDFDHVESELVAPALERLGVEGRTTINIVESGNIRTDMFRRLLAADLIVADLSIHSASVFYELGIRHALRARSTFLMRCEGDGPTLDLQTERQFEYRRDDPAASLEAMVTALRQTFESSGNQDSPIFLTLPNLPEPEASSLITVPADFREEVRAAAESKRTGDLALLSHEVRGFEWETEGWRVVGREQFNLKAFHDARVTWESVRQSAPEDVEANLQLGTVYQRLGDLDRSTQALERALANKDIKPINRAEAYSLLARNTKARWRQTWGDAPPEERPAQALRSSYLQASIDAYAGAFEEDLNHFYSGLNALALTVVRNELAAALPDVWADLFSDDDEAERKLKASRETARMLAAAVEQALQATRGRLKREGKVDMWAEISHADLRFLTGVEPRRVAARYRDALTAAPEFARDSVRTQLDIYKDLGLFKDSLEAVYSVVGESDGSPAPGDSAPERRRVLLFVGHMIDAPDRASPRFPADREPAAREKIREAVAKESGAAGAVGYAGGSSGGDILFHEVCAKLGVETRLYLAIPPHEYVKSAGVLTAGPQWAERFWKLYEQHQFQGGTRVLSAEKEASGIDEYLPAWLRSKPEYGVWQRNNLWTLFNALDEGRDPKTGEPNITLVALWDGQPGAGAGGVSDLVAQVQRLNARAVIIHTGSLLDAGAAR